jgi:hypothetical protein
VYAWSVLRHAAQHDSRRVTHVGSKPPSAPVSWGIISCLKLASSGDTGSDAVKAEMCCCRDVITGVMTVLYLHTVTQSHNNMLVHVCMALTKVYVPCASLDLLASSWCNSQTAGAIVMAFLN